MYLPLPLRILKNPGSSPAIVSESTRSVSVPTLEKVNDVSLNDPSANTYPKLISFDEKESTAELLAVNVLSATNPQSPDVPSARMFSVWRPEDN